MVMSKIIKVDTNGIKPLLDMRELGYDNYPAGGDVGRVYVGTGTANIALAKKTEVTAVDTKADTHIGRLDNPHSVTKAQVGLGNADNTSDVNKPVSTATQTALNLKANLASPTFTGTVSGITKAMVGLGSADNTADSTKVVASAAKLTTARTINGVSFDGTANITVEDSTKVSKTSDTGSAKLPVGTTAQRDAVSVEGMIRYNSTTLGFEGYSNGMWQPVAVRNDTKKRRNYLINGNFQFWDYATSQTSAGYGSDNRWRNQNNGSTKVHSRMTSGDTERAFFESPYYSRTVVSSVVGVGNYTQKYQRIEDVTKLAGKTVTLSFCAKADSAKNIAIVISQHFGSGGSPSTYIDVPLGLVNLSTTWKKHTITTTLPSLIGKTLGTDGVHTSHTQISIALEAGSNFNTVWSNLGQQSGTFDIAEVKLEDGSTATDGWSPYDGEWGSEAIARMRYLTDINGWVGMIDLTNTSAVLAGKLAIPLRISPSVAYHNASIHEMSISSRLITGILTSSIASNGGYIRFSMSSAGTTQNTCNISGTVLVSAEL